MRAGATLHLSRKFADVGSRFGGLVFRVPFRVPWLLIIRLWVSEFGSRVEVQGWLTRSSSSAFAMPSSMKVRGARRFELPSPKPYNALHLEAGSLKPCTAIDSQSCPRRI